MDNIISIKKHKDTLTRVDKQRLDNVIDMLNRNITDGELSAIRHSLVPIYSELFTVPERWEYFKTYLDTALKMVVEKLNLLEVSDSFLKSDFPELLRMYEESINIGFPNALPIPFIEGTVTIVTFPYAGKNIISDIFIRNESAIQAGIQSTINHFKLEENNPS